MLEFRRTPPLVVLAVLAAAAAACGDPGPTSGDENLSVVGNLEISAAMKAPDSLDAEVMIRNTGPLAATVRVVCLHPLHLLTEPEGDVVWPWAYQCNLVVDEYQIDPGDTLKLTAYGPNTDGLEVDFQPGEYWAYTRLDLEEREPISLPIGWVTFD